MAGLARVAGVYRLLERVRLAEATAASAGLAEVDRGLEEMEAIQSGMRSHASAGVEDSVLRSSTQLALQSSETTLTRLHTLREARVRARDLALTYLSTSRVSLKQVEEVLLASQREKDLEQARRTQAEADERFLTQRFRARSEMKRF